LTIPAATVLSRFCRVDDVPIKNMSQQRYALEVLLMTKVLRICLKTLHFGSTQQSMYYYTIIPDKLKTPHSRCHKGQNWDQSLLTIPVATVPSKNMSHQRYALEVLLMRKALRTNSKTLHFGSTQQGTVIQ
jgi:hypothetical protein